VLKLSQEFAFRHGFYIIEEMRPECQ
jgi:hypothetical protein